MHCTNQKRKERNSVHSQATSLCAENEIPEVKTLGTKVWIFKFTTFLLISENRFYAWIEMSVDHEIFIRDF